MRLKSGRLIERGRCSFSSGYGKSRATKGRIGRRVTGLVFFQLSKGTKRWMLTEAVHVEGLTPKMVC